MNEKVLKQVMSELGKLSHKKSPRSREFYRKIQAKSVAKRKANQLSTETIAE